MLKFNVPDTDQVLQHTAETRPKAVAQWLDRLPLSSPVETAQQLVMALYALNRTPLGAEDRYALLALYRPVILHAIASLQTRFAESGVPPNAQQRQIGALLRELQIEHSIGYKEVLMGLVNRRFGRPSSKRTAEVTARLLASLSDIQTACYLTYTPLPDGLWQEIHQTHALAQESGMANTAVEDMPPASRIYSQALLIALADPPHMSHAELVHTRLYLERFVELTVLATAPVPQHCGFPINTGGGAPSNFFTPDPATSEFWLDTDALCRHLHKTAVSLRAGETPLRLGLAPEMDSELSQRLCKRLIRKWSGGAQRAYKRYASAGSTLQLIAGMNAIHRMLDQGQETPLPNPDETYSVSVPGIAPMLAAAPVSITPTEWTVINDSASGIAVSGQPDAPLNLKVGDPLAMRTNEAAAWSLGVIRWVRMRDAQQLELGIERLSPQIQPVWVRPLRGQYKKNREPALFIPGIAALKQEDRLMLPRHLYEIGIDADVWHTLRQYTITFGKGIEQTPSFYLINFTVFTDDQP